jgi:hypothetical protein
MSNERPDDFQAWRSLLGQPDALPEQGLADKDATWDRLFERLAEKPRRRWPVYGVAAACILLALVPAARLFQDRPVNPTGRHTRLGSPVRSASAFSEHRKTLLVSAPPAAQRSTPVNRLSTRRHTPDPVAIVPLVNPSMVSVDRQTIPPSAMADPGQPLLAIHSVTPPRREWKVVNLTELNSAAAHPHSMASTGLLRLIRNGLGKQSATGENSTPTASPPEEDNGIKIKLSAQN